MIKVLLVEDEIGAIEVFKNLLAYHQEDFQLQNTARSVKEALTFLNQEKPDLLVLDISLPDGTGFDVLEAFGSIDFEVIFVTAHEEFALKAIKNNCFDYILKPLHSKDMHDVLHKVKEKILKENVVLVKKIAVHTLDGIEFIDQEDLLYLKAESNYTNIHLKSGRVLVASKTLRSFEDKLQEKFIRIHQSYITNSELIVRYLKSDSVVYLKDGKELPVSRTRRESLLKVLL